MMQEAPQRAGALPLSTSAASTTAASTTARIDAPSSRLVCARCDAGQLRSVLNQPSAMPRANGAHRGDEEDSASASASDEDDDGICGVDAAFSRLAASAAQPARPPPRRANPPPPPPSAAATASASDPDLPGPEREPSAAMGDLLLKGWTMLGEACPACGGTTPLMRKRGGFGGRGGGGVNEGETYCVKCRAWVRYQEEGEEGAAAADSEPESESEEGEEAAVAAAPPARRPARAPTSAAAAAASAVSEAEDAALVDARQALVEALRDATLALRRRRGGGGGGGERGGGGGRESSGGTINETSSDSSCRASAARLVGECARALAVVRAALGA